MKPAMRSTRDGLFLLGIAAALGFGATQAFATNPPGSCTVPTAWGTCHSQAECQYYCLYEIGTPEGGSCNLGTSCCYCIM